jgi:hypothetical protein
MPFTSNCDLYGAVHEDGINLAILHLQRQRPSLFNYATADIAGNQDNWCQPIPATADVYKYKNPLFTIMDPIPVFGADSPKVDLGFIAQVSNIKIDFFPSNAIALPPALTPPLQPQHFALQVKVCGSVVCPSAKEIGSIPFGSEIFSDAVIKAPTVHLSGQIKCFCLDVFAVGHVQRILVGGQISLLGIVDGLEILDLTPTPLKNVIICYLKTTLNVILREKLTIAFNLLMLNLPLGAFATVTLAATANPPIPNNPAIEDDLVKAFITIS